MQQQFFILHLFSGIGGAALGFQQAQSEHKGIRGQFHTLAGIDCDPEACEDFERITGAPAVQMDLFDRQDYIDYHGQEPPAEWEEARPKDIRKTCKDIPPDVVFLSPPCKGFSALLPKANAATRKYQALNRLVIRGLFLVLEAFRKDPPGIILLENVPRITTRGARLLQTIKAMLNSYGYVFHEGYHDCGEIGSLGQRRKRYLLIARLPERIPAFVYQPPIQRVKSISEVLGPLPLPDDPAAGLMHKLPRLQWKTWIRLALIPAGGDWRDLEKIAPEEYRWGGGPFGIQRWNEPAGNVIGNANVKGSNAACVADPRLPPRPNRHPIVYRVMRWEDTGLCVTGARFGSGAPAVADPRVHSGPGAVADPQIPEDTDRPDPPPVIIAEDGTWHRPLTTLELAVLQGFPLTFIDGFPLVLAGKSDARWRERIGNAVPPPAAAAIGEQILRALLLSKAGEWELTTTKIWVIPQKGDKILENPDQKSQAHQGRENPHGIRKAH